MLKAFLIAFSLIFSITSFAAEPTGEDCAPTVRKAQYTAEITRMHWVKNGADYKVKSEAVCTSSGKIGVLPGRAAGCVYPLLASCEIELDGRKYRLNVSGVIYHSDEQGDEGKHFTAGYHLNRNKTVKTGEASSADVTTDPSLKKIGVRVQSKLDSPHPAFGIRDGFHINVNYEDSDAP